MVNKQLIFWPVAVMVVLVFLVWCRLYFTRVREMRARRISPQALATRATARRQLVDSLPVVDNFSNLFELPVLFYIAAILLYASDRVDGLYLALAWTFVALRYVHSAIHVTYNRVMHRFPVYVLGAIPLWVMWARLVAQWLA
ncbi:MAG: MAPEG family protein [Pseudomonadota bacterium]|mgnify:FL=1